MNAWISVLAASCVSDLPQWPRQESDVGGGAKFSGSEGRKSPSGVQVQGPGEALGDLGAKPREAEKHDINFALRITLVNEYCPFYSITSRLYLDFQEVAT